MEMRLIFFFFIISFCVRAQEGTYSVKQFQSGNNLDSLQVASNNPFITEVRFLKDGMQIFLGKGNTFIPFHKLNKKDIGKNAYTYSMQMSEQWNVKFFIAPYPTPQSKPKLVKALMSFTDMFPNEPDKMMYGKMVFWDEQKIAQ